MEIRLIGGVVGGDGRPAAVMEGKEAFLKILFRVLWSLALSSFYLLENSPYKCRGIDRWVHNMPCRQIRSSTSSGDLRRTSDAYLVTVNYVLLCTMTKASKRYKFDDV
jgi:hypothetical protein